MTAREPQTGRPKTGYDGGRYASFSAFYPYYIHEHSNRACRRIHVVGTGLVIAAFAAFCVTGNAWWLLAMPLVGYGFAWVGHFFFEKNRPATFKYPLWSLMGDFRLFFETVSGKRKF
ncbi:Mpo1-like protein [Brevundimonas sp. NPDC046655]|uniref:Mpo1-like protein n=1 Tax=unclassified Brevundimonas TaxID=2622653 RepID=UPI00384B600F